MKPTKPNLTRTSSSTASSATAVSGGPRPPTAKAPSKPPLARSSTTTSVLVSARPVKSAVISAATTTATAPRPVASGRYPTPSASKPSLTAKPASPASTSRLALAKPGSPATSSSRPAPAKPSAAPSSAKPTPPAVNAEPVPDPYEDDFEEYDEDFEEYVEEDDTKPVVKITSVPPVVASVVDQPKFNIPKSVPVATSSPPVAINAPTAPTGANLNSSRFVPSPLPSRRNVILDMHRRRQRDLATFIELEPTPTWTVFDLPPLSQYELYIRQYGKSNTVQTATQFKDEDEIAEQAVQCEGVETAPKWVQTYGGEGREGSGGDILTSKKPAASTSDIMGFLQRSAWVMEKLIETNLTSDLGSGIFDVQNDSGFSESKIRLNTSLSMLKGRSVVDICFAPMDHQLLLTAWSMPIDALSDSANFEQLHLNKRGLLTIWMLTDTTRPWKTLLCEGEPVSICFGSQSSNLVFAGTSDGNVCVWNLRDQELGNMHVNVDITTSVGNETTSLPVQYPSFMSHYVDVFDGAVLLGGALSRHQHGVCRVEVVPQLEDKHKSSSGTAGGELITNGRTATPLLQIMSLDTSGLLITWVLLDVSKYNNQDDFAVPFGSSMRLHPVDVQQLPGHQSTMARIPSDASAFLSATATTGEILHRGRTGGKKMPWKFQSSGDFGAPTKRTKSIAFHPLFHDIFMAAYADGDLALFDMAQSTTIRRWTLIDTGRDGNAPPERIASFAWSQQRPSVFYVLDERGRLWVWDLLVSEREAVKIVDVVEDIPVCAGRVLAVSNGSSTNSTMNGRSSKTVPMMALALDVCEKQSAPYYACIEVHVLDTTLTEHTIGDLECFRESIYR